MRASRPLLLLKILNRYSAERAIRSSFAQERRISSKTPLCGDEYLVPLKPVKATEDQCSATPSASIKFDSRLLTHLEQLSLVRFSDTQAVDHLRSAIQRADKLEEVDTRDVEPMYFVWEDQEMIVDRDHAEAALPADKVFENAARSMENHFVTPPGNIPLEADDNIDTMLLSRWDQRK